MVFAVAARAPVVVKASASGKAQKVQVKKQAIPQKAAGAAAALILMASPAAFADSMGLVLQNDGYKGPAKYSQPLADLRPYVEVEKDGSADVTDFKGRIAANKKVGLKNCKTISGAPCYGHDIPNFE